MGDCVTKIKPVRNAVVIQFLPNGKKVVCIECMDKECLDDLVAEARTIDIFLSISERWVDYDLLVNKRYKDKTD